MSRAFALVGVLLLLSGCPGMSRRDEVMPEATPLSPEFVNGGECAPDTEGLHPRAGCVTTTHNELATLYVYAIVGRDSRPKRWRVRFEADSMSIDQPLDAGNPFSYPRALAAIDVNGDEVDEWLIKSVDLAGHGTNWQRLEILVVEDESLEPVSFEGQPFYVNVGGISRMGEGARCDGNHFVLLRTEAENRKNTVWSFSERMFEIEGTKAKYVDRRSGELQLSDYNDPQLDPYYEVMCGSFVYP